MNLAIALITAWLMFGLGHFLIALNAIDKPTRWRERNPRYLGWRDVFLIGLPVCLVGGPVLPLAAWLKK